MATVSPFFATPRGAELLGKLAQAGSALEWETPSDLSRMSVHAMRRQLSPWRDQVSQGQIRLYGAGVTNHSAALTSVGQVMLSIQKVVDAIGASIKGHHSSRGKLPESVLRLTRLDLEASPAPGSLILEIHPAVRPDEELSPQASFIELADDDEQLSDQAMARFMEILDRANKIDVVDDSFADELRTSGPRVAQTVRSFARAVALAEFDSAFTWDRPNVPIRRVSTTSRQMSLLASFIETRDLGAELRTLTGIVSGVAKTSTALVLETDTGLVQIKRGEIPLEEIERVHVNDLLRVEVTANLKMNAGGEEIEVYQGIRVSP